VLESMTGYARAEVALAGTPVTLELRSVNHRFLDLTLRLPEALRDQEGAVRARLRDAVSRGKVDLIVRIEGGEGQGGALQPEVLATVLKAVAEVRAQYPEAQPDSPLELLRWPGVWATTQPDLAALKACFWEGLEVVLNDFLRERQREGAGLQRTLELRLAQLGDLVGILRGVQDALQEQLLARLRSRADALGVEHSEERLAQELALLAQKADICEELDRLSTHREAFLQSLSQPGAQGKRLDFLAQELAREANTCAAKISDGAHTETVVTLKVLIEQLREQVQNVA
jgi:uncharacterized protein (TIGR00255 family)